jgi:putative oxidoreductase
MTTASMLGNRWVLRALSIGVGAAFVYAGAIKLGEPLALADTVAAFGILPNFAIATFALALPAFEILAGILLVTGWRRRVGALAVTVAISAYTLAIASALARGITIDCGCFGIGPATRGQMWWDLARDLVLLAAASTIYLVSLSREAKPS